MTGLAIPYLFVTVLAAIAPLSDAQRQLLVNEKNNDPNANTPGLFALLENAWSWQPDDETGATVPDYPMLIKEPPSADRGEIFLIEGELRRVRPVGRLARTGPWDAHLSEWTIKWGRKPDEVVVVDLVDPPIPAPREGSAVRLAARFFKIWTVQDAQGQTTDFPLFVGRDARLVSTARNESTSPLQVALLLLAGVAGGVLIMRVLRISGRALSRPSARPAPQPEPDTTEDFDDQNLPEDPAEALRELHRRRENNPPST